MLLDQFRDILVDTLKIDRSAITPEATREDIELDSLAVVELSLLLKAEFDLDVSDDELLEAATVADMVALLEKRSATV
jgi:acyl carrier protein